MPHKPGGLRVRVRAPVAVRVGEEFGTLVRGRDAWGGLIGVQVNFGDGAVHGGFGFDVCGPPEPMKKTRFLRHTYYEAGQQSVTVIVKTSTGCEKRDNMEDAIVSAYIRVLPEAH